MVGTILITGSKGQGSNLEQTQKTKIQSGEGTMSYERRLEKPDLWKLQVLPRNVHWENNSEKKQPVNRTQWTIIIHTRTSHEHIGSRIQAKGSEFLEQPSNLYQFGQRLLTWML